MSFTSFRHGGFTETGDAELTDREIMAQGRKATVKTLPKYVKRTTKQIITGTKKRRASRTKTDQIVRMSGSLRFRMEVSDLR